MSLPMKGPDDHGLAMIEEAARFHFTVFLETIKALLCSWTWWWRWMCLPLKWPRDRQTTGHFDRKSVLIVCASASDLLMALIRRILQSDVQCLIVASPDVNGFLQRIDQLDSAFFSSDDDSGGREDRTGRLFFQPNDLRDEERIERFIDNLRSNVRLRLHHVVLLLATDDDDDDAGGAGGQACDQHFPLQHFLKQLQQSNLLQPLHQSQLLVVSSDASLLCTLHSQCLQSQQPLLKCMLIGRTSHLSIHHVPRLSSCLCFSLFLCQWLRFMQRLFLTLDPDFVAATIDATMIADAQSSSHSFFIYGKPVK